MKRFILPLLLLVTPTHSNSNAATVSKPVTKRPISTLNLAIAGSVATMIGDISMHPIDCIKTLQQSNQGKGLSMLGASKSIFSKSGISGFYSGMGTYVASDGGAGAIKFATYEVMKQWVQDKFPEEHYGAALFGCAAVAFLASSVVLVPGELLKQRLQMGQIPSIRAGIRQIWKQEGILGFYTGYSGVCLRDVPYTMMELGVYDNLKSLYSRFKNRGNAEGDVEKKITSMDEIIAAAITGGITGYLSNPMDLIKTKMMVNTGLYGGFADCMRQTVAENGVGGLFQGGAARVSWLMPFTAIYLPIYEVIKRSMTKMGEVEQAANVAMRGGQVSPVNGPGPIHLPCNNVSRGGAFTKKKRRQMRLDGNQNFVSF